MMTRTVLPLLLCLALGNACSSHKQTQSTANPASKTGISWIKADNLAAVLETAQKQGKPVFVDFFATWCGPCKTMEREVFSRPEIAEYLNNNFLSYRLDVDKPNSRDLLDSYDVEGMPTVLFIDAQGAVLERELGLIPAKQFRKTAESALGKMKK